MTQRTTVAPVVNGIRRSLDVPAEWRLLGLLRGGFGLVGTEIARIDAARASLLPGVEAILIANSFALASGQRVLDRPARFPGHD
jgi:hypothetical protein